MSSRDEADPALLDDILIATAALDPQKGARVLTPSRRGRGTTSSPVNLDAVVLRDRRTGVVAVIGKWSNRIVRERDDCPGHWPQVETLSTHWAWALEQPWGPEMLEELTMLRNALDTALTGRPQPVRRCPVCGLLVRLDRFVTEHKACIATDLGDDR